jgi:Flp pilus assembly protein TadG
MGTANGRRGGWSGQAVVEFALSSLLFLALIFGTIDLGRLVFMRTMLTNAVREAARQAAITPGNLSAIEAAAQQRSPSLTLGAGSFTVTCSDWSGNARSCASGSTSPPSVKPLDRISVCSTYTFNAVVPRLIGRSSITATECMKTHVQ